MKRFFFLLCSLAFVGSALAQDIELPQPNVEPAMSLNEALMIRKTDRNYTSDELPLELLSHVLWCAYGINRPESHRRTVPSARNVQEMELYVLSKDGVYLYNTEKNILSYIKSGDYRAKISSQEHFAVAPFAIVIVADAKKLDSFPDDLVDFYMGLDCGYVSQDIYLAAAADGLGTVACGAIDRKALTSILNLSKTQKIMLAHPLGFVAR